MTSTPLVTLALFTYNQETYVRDAIDGVLKQTYKNLEIIISDDCSTDSTYSIIENVIGSYKGLHKIILNRNKQNLGLAGHVNFVVNLANGEYVVVAAGDDISAPNRVTKSLNIFILNPNCNAVFSNVSKINSNNDVINKNSITWNKHREISIWDIIGNGGGIGLGASYAYKKNILCNIDKSVINEDRILPLMAILSGEIIHI